MRNEWINKIQPADTNSMQRSQERWIHVAKPLFSLGKFETEIIRIAGMKRDPSFSLEKKALMVMCADNGIVEEGVTQTGKEVTAIVADNFTTNKTSTSLMAEMAGVDVFPIDIGMEVNVPSVTKEDWKVAFGTNNFSKEPAMTMEQLQQAIRVGIDLVELRKKEGYDIILTGEMGIGNTTTSSAIASVLLEADPKKMTGRGAGLDTPGLLRKIQVIENAIADYNLDKADVLEVMRHVGGYDIAGLCGVYLGGAIHQIPVVIDGFISSVAALCAVRICPTAKDYMLASHVSGEPAAKAVLDELELSPIIRGNMSLGEGSGAVALMPLLDMTLRVYREMSDFEDIHVEQYEILK